MDSNNKGGKAPLSLCAWVVIWSGITIVLLLLAALLPNLSEDWALLSSAIGSAMLCVAALAECIQKGKRRDKAQVRFKLWVAIGAILVYWGAWGLLFVRLEEIFNTILPL